MTSSRLVLIFLGIIFLIIIILSSGRIAGALRERFASFLPNIMPAEEIASTPTQALQETPTPTQPMIYGTSTPTGEIPATGPGSLLYLVLGGGVIAGISLRKIGGEI